MPAPASLTLRLLGGVQVERDGAVMTGFLSSKAPALLAYLAMTGGTHRREALAGLLWGELPEADAKNNLRQTLSNLRKLVGGHLIITRAAVGLDENQSIWLDAARFQQLVREDGSIRALTEAVGLYGGDFLAGFFPRHAPQFEEWMLAQRARLRELAILAWQALTEDALQRRDARRALDYAHRLLALDAWREEAHRQLMRALVYNGQPSAALAQFETCRHILHDALGVTPSLETTTLFERIRAAAHWPRSQLPPPPGDFLARAQEMAAIRAWLFAPDRRLLTLIGPGGVGKTRLALEAARAHRFHFLEGVRFVSLETAPVGGDLIPAVAAALPRPLPAARSQAQALIQFLHNKEMLLILDSLEHVLTPQNLDFLVSLLASAPELNLLVTSQARLGLRGETILELRGLPWEAASLPTSETPAGRLFLARARQARPDFHIREREAALARLCRLVEGLPLALELAASWARLLDLDAMVREVEQSMALLAADWPDTPARHRSLRAVFEHAWRLLTPAAQRLFMQLAVFRNGFTLDAGRAVTGASLHAMANLVDRSLLQVETTSRYRCHPLLHQFAHERLLADPSLHRAAEQAHARYFGRFLARLEPRLFGDGVEEALAQIRPELENVRQAWMTALRHGAWEVIDQMADAVIYAFDLLGMYREGLALGEAAVDALSQENTRPAATQMMTLGKAHVCSATFQFRLGSYSQARRSAQRARQALEPFRPHKALGHALLVLGATDYGLHDLARAEACWRDGLSIYQASGLPWGECAMLTNLAEVKLAQGAIPEARASAARALDLARGLGNSELLGVNLQILAIAAMHERDFVRARALCQQALSMHRGMQHQAQAVNALVNLAVIAAAQNDADQAAAYLTECTAIWRQMGQSPHLLDARLAAMRQEFLGETPG